MDDLQVSYPQRSAGSLVARNTVVAFRMAAAGRVYVRVDSLVSNLVGTEVVYRMNFYQGIDLFLPLIRKLKHPKRGGR